jgi:hypothetical protein
MTNLPMYAQPMGVSDRDQLAEMQGSPNKMKKSAKTS